MNAKELFIYLKQKKDYIQTGLNIDFAIEINTKNKENRLIFKETDSTMNWIENLAFLPMILPIGSKKLIVPRGFGLAYLSANETVIPLFIEACKKNPDFKILICGWSFGSVMSIYSMIDFYERTNKKPYVQTFGRVKCIYPISQFFDLSIFEKIEYSAEKIEEFANINDFVCWCNPFARAIKTVWVKDKFSLKKLFNTAYTHCNYQEVL